MGILQRVKLVWRAARDEWRRTSKACRAPVCVVVSTQPNVISPYGAHKPYLPECEHVRPTLDAIIDGTFELKEHWVSDAGVVRYGKKPKGDFTSVATRFLDS